MNANSIVSKKVISNNTFYRIHDVIEGVLVNIRCVKEEGKKLRVINDASTIKGLSDWLNDTDEINPVEEMEGVRVLKFLAEYQGVVLSNVAKIIDGTENAGALLDGISVGGDLFGFVGDTAKKGILRVCYIIGGETGKVTYFGAINKERHMERLIQWFLKEEDSPTAVYQLNDRDFMGIQDHGKQKAVISLSIKEEEGKTFFVGGTDNIALYDQDEEGEWKRVETPDLPFEEMEPLMNAVVAEIQKAYGFTVR